MSAEVEPFLEHFGIKGMRWGHRKAKETAGTKVPATRKTTEMTTHQRIGLGLIGAGYLAAGAATTHALISEDFHRNPQPYLKAAAFMGQRMRTPIKLVAKGAKIVFNKGAKGGMMYYPPGTYHPGDFLDTTRAIGVGMKMLTR